MPADPVRLVSVQDASGKIQQALDENVHEIDVTYDTI